MEKSSRDSEVRWDLFICHASEDKDDFVRPLAERLVSVGLKVWYDDFTLKVGDSLRRSIDEGLSKSRYGVVILSPSFFKKEWPQKELDGLVAKEIDVVNVILPVWHNVDISEVKKYSLILSDKVAAKSSDGLENVVSKLMGVVKANIHDESIKKENIPTFSEEETDILISALGSQGTIYLLERDQTGKFLKISDRDYLYEKKPEFRISYLEALDKLIERSLVRQETERWFVLSKIGFEYAHGLEINSLKDKAWEYFENKKDYVKSIETYIEIVRKYPDSGIAKEAQKMIGVNYLHLYDFVNAEKELKKSIDMGNDFSSAHFYYGEALLNNKKYREAKMAYVTSLSKPDAPEWIKTSALDKIMLCQKEVTETLVALADEKYAIEKNKIDKEIPLQEANLKEKAGLRGLRYSSPLARELLELNLVSVKKKIETRLNLDKEIIFSGNNVKTDGDTHLLMERLRVVADAEKMTLKEKIVLVYRECHANGLIDADMRKIGQEIETLLKEIHTNLLIEKETAKKD